MDNDTALKPGPAALLGAAAPDRQTFPLGLLLIFFGTRWTAYLAFHILPVTVGAVVGSLGVSTQQAGYIASTELLAASIASLLVAPRVVGRTLWPVAVAGALLASTGQFASAFAPGFWTLAAARLIAGSGAGILSAAANASLANTARPDLWFARIGMIGSVAGAVLAASMPPLMAQFGPRSVFPVLGAVMLLVSIAARFLPVGAAARPIGAPKDSLLSRSTVLTLGALALFSLGQGMVWAFAERLAHAVRLTPEQLGFWFLLCSVAGVSGQGLAAWLGTRFGRLAPLALGTLVVGAASLAFSMSRGNMSFGTTLFLYWAAAQFVFPYYFGLCAALDRGGRLVTLGTTLLLMMSAAAPTLGASVIQNFGFPALGLVVLAASIGATALILIGGRGADSPHQH